ncbi:hypothetical protein [Mariniblastus fucicola]|uniref:DUF4350 domain-containing protein n=1 Tax=Mariniblastus fucicola TaxID=980251 RepID=A0A5B9PEE3_9BACT|nr:hypothetical protein [Mariniblastus fucicola]QEG25077.1 hypothetical protein MFFC18_50000 [Mariniblastus fucicola]
MPQLSQFKFAIGRIVILSLLAFLAFSSSLAADEVQESPIEVSVGVGGYAKLGHWVPVQFKITGRTSAENATQFRVNVLDGDDTPSSIVGPLVKTENGFQGVMQFGRTYGDASFELLDDNGEVLDSVSTQILKDNNSFMKLLPATSRLLACVEPEPKGAASIAPSFSAAFAGGVTDDDRVASIESLIDLPQIGIAYESCESLILLANDSQWISRANADSLDAIETWVRNGGNFVIVSAADQGSLFQSGGLLERFSPGTVVGAAELDSSRRLEEFCSSKEPYLLRSDTMKVLKIENANGRVALGQGSVPLIIRRALGLGEITFVAFDPTKEQFRNWKASSRFMQSVMKLRTGDESTQSTNDARSGAGLAVRHSGYDDLVGQMKVPLERFTSLRFIPFALIAFLIALYILCIGVGDWFLVGRVFKKHELTWVTFPLLAALFCGIAWYAAKASRPATIQLNQVELIDIDSISDHVRTTAWANLYSPNGRTVDLSLEAGDVASDRDLVLESSRLTWLGLPGDGLGGMLNRANPGLYRTGYVQKLIPMQSNPTELSVDMKSVELQVSSTRPLFGQWNGRFDGRITSRLRMTDRLEGTFTNPFDVPLKDCRVFYRGLVYVVGKSIPADGDIDIGSETVEKTVRSYLTRRNRREDDKNKSQSVAWDPRDVNLSRIMQMMMFYHSSGGSSYTGLSHSYHDFIEMTPQSLMDRAIVVGRLEDRVSTIEIDGKNADEFYDSSLTMVRVLLPVEQKND